MRVLHLLKTAVGASWALRQVRELIALGVELHVAMPDGPMIERFREIGATVHTAQFSLPVSQPHRWPALFTSFRQLVAEIEPNLIHSHFVGTTLTMRLALGKGDRTPRLFQVPGPLHLEHTLFRRLEIESAGPSDSWMGSCRWTCERYRASGIEYRRVFLSYYGNDLDKIERKPAGRLRAELGLTDSTRIVGMVAYLYAPKRYLGQRRGLKGHEDLIDALAFLRQQGQDVAGVFVGGAWNGAVAYEARVRDYARSRLGDRAHFLGTRTDVPDLYPDFDVVVHPSHSENVGGAAESLMLGVPTIATNVGGFPDLVRPGETGWLVPPGDPIAIAAAITDALGNPEKARRYARQGESLARQLMDIRRNAADVFSAYEQILGIHQAVAA